jgi:ribonuclease R
MVLSTTPYCKISQRERNELKNAQFMMTKMGEEFPGFVNTLATFGMFVELDDYFVEGLVRLSTLTDDDYDYYEKEYLIKGRRHGKKFRLGDSVRVRVAKINAFRSEIDFELVQTNESSTDTDSKEHRTKPLRNLARRQPGG